MTNLVDVNDVYALFGPNGTARLHVGDIDVLPRVEVKEVVHGKWQWKYPNGWACSECGEWGLMIINRGICKSSYCPNCGADMRGMEE